MEHQTVLWEYSIPPASTENESRFVHAPLDWKEAQIRLITIIPAESGPIHCKVRHVDLNGDRTPDYRALSYTWGSPEVMQHIWLNDLIFAVRLNLFHFLEAFRAHLFKFRGSEDHKAEIQWLWVDQICVDQSVLQERNHQVQMMADIYKRATYVYVWLGEADDAIEEVMRALKRSYRCHHKSAQELQLSTAMRQLHFNDDDKLDRISPHALERFFGKPYWRRLWIVQEVMLAKYIRVMCGETTLTWEVLQRFCGSRLKTLSTNVVQAVPVQVAWLAEHALSGRNYSYADLLWTFCLNECQEPRDKVYGFQGLLKQGDRMTVDYEKPVLEIFLHLAEAMVEGNEYMRPTNLGEGLEGIDYRRSEFEIFSTAANILQLEIDDRMRLRLIETLTRLGDQMGLAISDMKAAEDMVTLKRRIREAWTHLVLEYSLMLEDETGTQTLGRKQSTYLEGKTQVLSGYYDSLIGAARSLLHAILSTNLGDSSLVKKINFDTNTLLPSYVLNLLGAFNHVQRSITHRSQRLKLKDCQINLTVSSGWIIKRIMPFLDKTNPTNRTGLVLDYVSKKKPVKIEIEVLPLPGNIRIVRLETLFREQNDTHEYTLFMAVHVRNIDRYAVSVREQWELYFDCSVGSTQMAKDTGRLICLIFSIDGPDAKDNEAVDLTPISILKLLGLFSEKSWAFVKTYSQSPKQDTGTEDREHRGTMGLWRWEASGRLQKRSAAQLRHSSYFVPIGFCGI